MRSVVSLLAVSLLCPAAAQAGDDVALKKALEAVAGKWKFLKVETGGGGPNESVEGAFLDIAQDGKTLAFIRGGKANKGTFTIDPAKKPKEITITRDGSNRSTLGIYRIEKNVMTLCYARKDGAERPKEFAATKDEKFMLMTLERAK